MKNYKKYRIPPLAGKTHIGVDIVMAILENRTKWRMTEPVLIVTFSNQVGSRQRRRRMKASYVATNEDDLEGKKRIFVFLALLYFSALLPCFVRFESKSCIKFPNFDSYSDDLSHIPMHLGTRPLPRQDSSED